MYMFSKLSGGDGNFVWARLPINTISKHCLRLTCVRLRVGECVYVSLCMCAPLSVRMCACCMCVCDRVRAYSNISPH